MINGKTNIPTCPNAEMKEIHRRSIGKYGRPLAGLKVIELGSYVWQALGLARTLFGSGSARSSSKRARRATTPASGGPPFNLKRRGL